MVIENSA